MLSQMIFSSNRKSVNYSKNPNRSTDNSKWNTLTDIDVNIGDQLSIYNAVLNLRGASADATIEILDTNQPASGLTDATCGIEFTPYVNDNARDNTIALPYTGFTNKLEFNLNYPSGDIRYPFLDPLENNKLIVPQAYVTNTSDKVAPYNGNEMNCTNMYNFSYSYQSDGNQVCNPRYIRTLYTEPASQTSISSGRYIVLDNYLGPHKKEDGSFWSDECNEKKLFIKINIGESYSAPEVIANEINDILHDTNDFNDNNLNPIIYDYLNRPLELPSITGKLLYNKIVNGADSSNDATDGGRSRLYGNIAVKNLLDWKALHTLNKVSLSFESNVGFNEGGDILYTLNRPSFIMPRGYMTNNDNDDKNIDCAWFPRVRKELQYKTAYWVTPSQPPSEHQSHTQNYYYTCLPENFMIITNIEYNENNLKLLSQYQNYKEKNENNDTDDLNNYKMYFDIGESQQGFTDTQRSEYLFYTSQGSLNLIQNNDWKSTPDFTKYAYSYPYVPFKAHLQTQGYNEFASNRSDIPNIGYMQCVSEINVLLATLSYIAVITEIDQDVPQRFKNNKEGNASMAVKSRYIDNWRDLMKFDNLDGSENLAELPEGCGMYDTSYFDPNTQDDSLSKKYNIGAYPIDMHANKNPIILYDLSNTFWICNGIENNNILKFTIPYNGFLLKIVSAGIDQDHQTYGGYAIYEFLDNPAGWHYQSDYYIYCHQNQNVKAGRNPLTDVTYNNGIKIDMTTHGNIFVIDAGNTKRWIISVDVDHFDVYPMDGYSDDAGPDYDNLNNYNILGGEPYPNGTGGYIEVKATNFHIISTDPNSRYYIYSRFGVPINANGNNPVSIPQADNPSHVVCGFLLYRDSAKRSGNDWTISNDYALPSLHQGIQALSMSFLDHEAVWLVNEEMWDTTEDITQQKNTNTINYLSIGANNPTFSYEDTVSKFAFSFLHNPVYLGLEDMPKEETNNIVSYDTSNLGQLVMKFNDDKIKRNWLFKLFDAFRAEEGNPNTAWFTGFGPYDINYNMTYSDGGLFITNIYGEPSGTNANSANQMTAYNADNFDGLLYKLGFVYSDLIKNNTLGNQSSLFVYGKNTNLAPLTTNPSLDITNGLNFTVQDYTEPNSAGVGEPLYNRGIGSLQPVNIQATASEFLYASNIPEKNNDGFYLIYCNLSKSNYIDGESTYSIIGNVMKNYITGDYIYAFQQPSYVFDYPFKITDIQIEIRNANGDLIALNDDNSVIFQLVRNQILINNNKKK